VLGSLAEFERSSASTARSYNVSHSTTIRATAETQAET